MRSRRWAAGTIPAQAFFKFAPTTTLYSVSLSLSLSLSLYSTVDQIACVDVAVGSHSHPRYSSDKQLTSLHHNSVKAVEEARHASVARQRTKRLRGTRLE